MSVALHLVFVGSAAFAATAGDQQPLCEWYFADGILTGKEVTPETGVHGANGWSNDWLVIFNLSPTEEKATLTLYFEDAAPKQVPVSLRPSANTTIDLSKDIPAMPTKKLYGLRVQSATPVVAQLSRAESQSQGRRVDGPNGNSLMSRLGHPGPLGAKEKVWLYPDMLVGWQPEGKKGWEDWERVSILNPNKDQTAKVTITFNYRDKQLTKSLEVAAERVACMELFKMADFVSGKSAGCVIKSDLPVAVEFTRHSFMSNDRQPAGGWTSPAYAVGDLDLSLPTAK